MMAIKIKAAGLQVAVQSGGIYTNPVYTSNAKST